MSKWTTELYLLRSCSGIGGSFSRNSSSRREDKCTDERLHTSARLNNSINNESTFAEVFHDRCAALDPGGRSSKVCYLATSLIDSVTIFPSPMVLLMHTGAMFSRNVTLIANDERKKWWHAYYCFMENCNSRWFISCSSRAKKKDSARILHDLFRQRENFCYLFIHFFTDEKKRYPFVQKSKF